MLNTQAWIPLWVSQLRLGHSKHAPSGFPCLGRIAKPHNCRVVVMVPDEEIEVRKLFTPHDSPMTNTLR